MQQYERVHAVAGAPRVKEPNGHRRSSRPNHNLDVCGPCHIRRWALEVQQGERPPTNGADAVVRVVGDPGHRTLARVERNIHTAPERVASPDRPIMTISGYDAPPTSPTQASVGSGRIAPAMIVLRAMHEPTPR